jgi:CzcA family heavy metal efflux pump
MIARLIEWSLHRRVFVLFGALLLLGWGSYEAARMPVDVFPDLTAPSVTVVTEAHGMAPQEVEVLISFPLETAVNGAPGVRRVRSNNSIGISVVTVEFDWGTDVYQARQIVAERLATVRAALPPDVPEPTLAPITSIMGEIMFIALHSDRHDLMQLKTTADWVLRRRLLAVPGVAEVIPNGGETRQFQVVADPGRMAAFDVTVDQLTQVLGASNENVSAGFFEEGGQEFLIHGRGRVRDLEDIAGVFVAQRGERAVLIGDVAEVRMGPAPTRGAAAFNGEAAVVIGIQKQPGANTLALTRTIDAVLAEIQPTLPDGMQISSRLFRQADFIEVGIDNLGAALRDGLILVIAIVFVFLLSARATLITLLAIPLSLAASIIAMKAAGIGINTMTLGGMVIALGALVDDAIIVVENSVRRLRMNAALPPARQRNAVAVVYGATREIQSSVVFATVVIVLVFLPVFFLTGVEGRLMQPLGFAYVVALVASLAVAMTVTPVLCSLWLARSKTVRESRESRLSLWMKARYLPLLSALLPYWRSIGALSLVGVAITLAALLMAGRAFLPDFNEGSLTINVVTLPGTSLGESSALAARVERVLLAQPEVFATGRRTGRAELDPHAQEIYASEIEVTLQMGDRSKQQLLATLRDEFSAIAGANVVIGQPISHRIDHMLSGTRANIAIKLFGPDLYELRRLGQRIEAEVRQVQGAVDVQLEQQSEIPFVTIAFDRRAIARYGLTIGAVSQVIETAFRGTAVSRILEGEASFDLVLRFPDDVRESIERMRALQISTPTGARVPLSALASVERSRGPNQIGRENVQRRIITMANVADRDLGSVVADARARIESNVALPVGYHVEYGGQFESAAAAARTLLMLGSVVIIGMFLLLYLAFETARDALLVMLNLPLALLGGVAGVYASGGVLTVASIIGFITLFGIATRNGVMLIAHIHHLEREEGIVDAVERVRRGAVERLIPITMTALATALALVPLALSAGQPGSEIQAPMAVVILCGLLSSTVLNMVVIPTLYLRFGQYGERAGIASARG